MSDVIRVYNRPARVEKRYERTARVRYQDNGTRGYVPLAEVTELER